MNSSLEQIFKLQIHEWQKKSAKPLKWKLSGVKYLSTLMVISHNINTTNISAILE